jgi:RNA polymerase sigma-70 factor (ECF subfamily)
MVIRRMSEQDRQNLFSESIARHQSQLYAYIFAVVRNQQDADDLFQAVCLILWKKFRLFRPGTSFFSWARQTAYLEIYDFLKRRRSPNHVAEDLLDALAAATPTVRSDATAEYLDALHSCRKKLNAADASLLGLRYIENLGTHEIAGQLQRPQPSVCNSLARIRGGLLDCITKKLAMQDRLMEDRT